jgi:hypothetical protein
VSNNEVDLSDFLECQLQESGTVSPEIGRPDLELEVVHSWVEKRKELRVGQKDIDIVAFTMVDWEHHGRAAAERP